MPETPPVISIPPVPPVPWPHVDVVAIFALISLVGLMVMIAVLAFVPIPKENQQLVSNIAMLYVGMVVTIGSFYFGSSKGSAAKDQTLAAMATTTAAAIATKDSA